MTDREAISNLNHIYGIVSPDIQKSLDVAIKALEGKRTQAKWDKRSYVSCGRLLKWKADVVEYRCSNCKRWSQWWFGTCKNEYCPHCGYKMTNDSNTIEDYKRGEEE